ncbi:MAG: efflux RND transporter periplasmic adaptor subunit [Chitinophagaceae bacterium]
MKNLLTTALVISVAIWISSCNGHAAEDPAAKGPVCISDSMMKNVSIDSATIQNIDDELKLSGEVSFNENKVVKIFPITSGQVLNVNVTIGDYVHAGQVLATIKSADIAGNYSDLKSAGSDVAIAKRAMENAKHLYENGIASEKEYLEAKESYDKAVSNASKIRTQISINGSGRTSANGTYVVTAPKSGYVVEKNINPGQFIRNDYAQNLFTVGNINDVWIWANVYESDIAKVKEGYRALVTTLAYPDSVFVGRVDKVNHILDPQTKVMKVKIILPNGAGALKPEMFANITVENKEGRRTVAIPRAALASDNGKTFVVVYHDKCNLELREVQPLKTKNETVYLRSGLNAGEQVLTKNVLLFFQQLSER